jgi:hypothetical protein
MQRLLAQPGALGYFIKAPVAVLLELEQYVHILFV